MNWPAVHQTRAPRRRINHQEDHLQRQVIDTVRYTMRYNERPLTDWLYAVPNGGKRSRITAAILKAMGVRAGVPDLALPIAAAPYGGLYIELKVGSNGLTDHQLDYHQRLREGGQCVATCRTLAETLQVIAGYMLRAPGTFEDRAIRLATTT